MHQGWILFELCVPLHAHSTDSRTTWNLHTGKYFLILTNTYLVIRNTLFSRVLLNMFVMVNNIVLKSKCGSLHLSQSILITLCVRGFSFRSVKCHQYKICLEGYQSIQFFIPGDDSSYSWLFLIYLCTGPNLCQTKTFLDCYRGLWVGEWSIITISIFLEFVTAFLISHSSSGRTQTSSY